MSTMEEHRTLRKFKDQIVIHVLFAIGDKVSRLVHPAVDQ